MLGNSYFFDLMILRPEDVSPKGWAGAWVGIGMRNRGGVPLIENKITNQNVSVPLIENEISANC